MVELRSRIGQNAAPRQTQGLTRAQQQSIMLLGLSNRELADLLVEAMAENPLLEPAADLPDSTRGQLKRLRNRALSPRARPLPPGLGRLFRSGLRGRGTGAGGEATNEMPDAGPSLQEHLLGQLGADVPDPRDRAIGRILIENVDEAGYLTVDVAEIAERLQESLPRVKKVLRRLQEFDPPGVFAGGLVECLSLQLAERGRLDLPIQRLLERLDLLAGGAQEALRRHCGVDAQRLKAMIGELKRLDPRPGLAFERVAIQSVVPDLSIERATDGGWNVELNDDNLPRLAINERYPMRGDAQVLAYLKAQRAAAQWLLRAMDRRAETLRQVGREIVRRQGAFLDGGIIELKPLSRREIAHALGLHESTISRAIAGKYAATPRGVLALADFFGGRLGEGLANEGLAPAAVRARLRRMVESEPAGRPLSDQLIARRLREDGIALSRRTVAKYREMLRIPASFQRRRAASL
jgi:RNA polymerase sigma-54 factor